MNLRQIIYGAILTNLSRTPVTPIDISNIKESLRKTMSYNKLKIVHENSHLTDSVKLDDVLTWFVVRCFKNTNSKDTETTIMFFVAFVNNLIKELSKFNEHYIAPTIEDLMISGGYEGDL